MFDLTNRPQAIVKPAERLWGQTALALGVLAVAAGWALVLRSAAMVQFDYDEGWNALRQIQAAHFLPLYAAPPGLDITNYPPLSFHIVGLLSLLTGDVTITARLLSLAALAAICLLAGALVRLFTPARHAGTCAALLFALWIELWMPNRIGVNDPQLLGMVFEMLGFYLFVRGAGSGRGVWLSAPLFAMALFTKHNLLALPLGAGLTLLAAQDWRRLISWVAAGSITGLALLLATFHWDGPYFLASLLQPRAYDVADTLRSSATYLIIFLPFVALAAAWGWRHRHAAAYRPLIFSWAVANVFACYCSGGDGVARNIFFEAILLDAVIAIIAAADYFAARPQMPPGRRALLCLLAMLFPLSQLPGHMGAEHKEWQRLPRNEADFAAAAALLHQTPGPAVCEDLLLCAEAGKPSAFDPYHVQDQTALGHMSAQNFAAMAAQQRFGAIEFGDTDMAMPERSKRFSPAFRQAVQAHYRIAFNTREMVIWVPAGPPPR